MPTFNASDEHGYGELEVTLERDYSSEVSYEMTEQEQQVAFMELRHLFEEQYGGTIPTRHGLAAIPDHFPGRVDNLARSVEAEVFARFGNTPDELQREYASIESDSLFIVATDFENNKVMGDIRLDTQPTHGGLKSLSDASLLWHRPVESIIDENQIEFSSTWDIATLAVREGYRGGRGEAHAVLALFHKLYAESVEHNVTHWVAIIDDPVLTFLQRIGIDARPMAGMSGQPYLGSESSTPTVVDLSQLRQGFEKKGRTGVGGMLMEGQGLRQYYAFLDDSLVLSKMRKNI